MNAGEAPGLRRGRVGHGTALVSPGARRTNAAERRDGLLAKTSTGTGGADATPSDLDFTLRQVRARARRRGPVPSPQTLARG